MGKWIFLIFWIIDDEDITKMMAINSNTQCYKQAGNSIVRDVMCRMFEKLLE